MIEYVGVAAGAAKAVGPVVSGSRRALQRLRLFGTFEVAWLDLERAGLTAADVTDLEGFLDSRDSRALLSALSMTLLTPHSDTRRESLDAVEVHFLNLAQRHWANRGNGWYSQRAQIWQLLLRIYDDATPAGLALAAAAEEYEDFLRTPLGRAQGTAGLTRAHGRYIDRLADLSSSVERVVNAVAAANEVKGAIGEMPAPPIISYTTTPKAATFVDLYVRRTLMNKATKEPVEGLRLGERGAPYRAVVHGAPGAGKSTFVRNLRQELALDADGQAVLLVTIRTYFSTSQQQPLIEYLLDDLRAGFNLGLANEALRDLLTLGAAVVIFDGLDEITDINQRIEMVQRISTFASEFPAVSILVTSRSIGYDRAPLPSAVFETLELDEYSKTQSAEYVERWFSFIERPDLVDDFENEAVSVEDLKKNPLLLSLLCILYRERGSIPRRRRDIYAQCADLLFHKWDSHRHLRQPEELHANGDRIMQELARWVFNSQKAQNGLSESVIVHAIGNYLRDTVGVEEGEARRRASEFLEFCADRAWLLGTTGTERGERLFGFTHRTFFEYFAAEAITRMSIDPSSLASTLMEAHAKDETSVLPELLLQSIDQKMDRGASQTFQKVCERTNDEGLVVRLMEGVPLPSAIRKKGFERILQVWSNRGGISRESFRSFLSINLDARDQFIRDFLYANASSARSLFLAGWADLELNGDVARFETAWRSVVTELSASQVVSEGRISADAVSVWRWTTGGFEMPDIASHFLTVPSSSSRAVGLAWLAVEMEVAGGGSRTDIGQVLTYAVSFARNRRNVLTATSSDQFAEALLSRLQNVGTLNLEPTGDSGLGCYLYLTAILYESCWYDPGLIDSLLEQLSPIAQALWASRADAADQDGEATRVVSPLLSSLPTWLKDWAKGSRAFTAHS